MAYLCCFPSLASLPADQPRSNTKLTGQLAQVQLEPQLQEPEEEQPQSPMMSVVGSKVCWKLLCVIVVSRLDAELMEVMSKSKKEKRGTQVQTYITHPSFNHGISSGIRFAPQKANP